MMIYQVARLVTHTAEQCLTSMSLGLHHCFSIDTQNARLIPGSAEAQFGYTVQQHEAGGQKW